MQQHCRLSQPLKAWCVLGACVRGDHEWHVWLRTYVARVAGRNGQSIDEAARKHDSEPAPVVKPRRANCDEKPSCTSCDGDADDRLKRGSHAS